MWEEMYPESNFVLQTPFPEVFEHLKETGMQVMKSGTKIPDVGFYECYLMPEPEKIVNAFITHSLCHPTDYASIMALKGQIPIALRTPKLKTKTLSNEIEDRLKRSVLIHPGKGWKSKTFPANFWAETCKSISEAGYHVAIIGKTVNETQGVVEFDHGDALNLIDKLDLLETFRAIELAPVLISNDSMPIHAAGAFDNWIGLIASCKHPDRILPYRKGYQRYKASALNVGLIYREYRPTHQIEVKMDDAEDWEIEKCLPKPEQIIQWLEKIPSGLKKIKT
jgi:ADP-heptose:LPS heptosyltransferase